MNQLWYRNAVIYSLDVRTFQDSSGDGIGDFDGLRGRLDYLTALGVNALWLKPFFPSPYRDGGYDIVDYYDVDESVGGLPSYLSFVQAAEERGLRIILDLPINRTSKDHPWFEKARSERSSKYRDYYIWEDEPPPNSPEQIVFRGEKPNPWTYDEQTGQSPRTTPGRWRSRATVTAGSRHASSWSQKERRARQPAPGAKARRDGRPDRNP